MQWSDSPFLRKMQWGDSFLLNKIQWGGALLLKENTMGGSSLLKKKIQEDDSLLLKKEQLGNAPLLKKIQGSRSFAKRGRIYPLHFLYKEMIWTAVFSSRAEHFPIALSLGGENRLLVFSSLREKIPALYSL